MVDVISKEEKQRHIQRLRQGKCTIELGFILSDVSTNLQRVSDHCSNVAASALQLDEEAFDTHEFLGMMKDESNREFMREFHNMAEKYKLPEM